MRDHKLVDIELIKTTFPFSLISEAEMLRILPYFDLVHFPTGTVIFSEGYPAHAMYFIVSGEVILTNWSKKEKKTLGSLTVGDHFGLESLQSGNLYLTRAKCQTDVTVLIIRTRRMQAVQDAFPQIRNVMELSQKTLKLSMKSVFPWLSEFEYIELLSRRHPFFLFTRILLVGGGSLLVSSFLFFAAMAAANPAFLLGLTGLCLLAGIGFSVWAAFEWTNDYFILTHERVLVQKKLIGFFESRHESPVNAILSVGIDTSVWGRMLGYGSVTVRTYTGDLRFNRLPFPHLINELIENGRQKARVEARQSERMGMRDALTQKFDPASIEKTQPMSKGMKSQANTTYASDSISDLMANFFGLRTQDQGSVVYRTHWWVLMGKLFLPTLALMTIVLGVIARFLGVFESIPETIFYTLAAITTLGVVGWWIYQYQDWHNDVYIITDEQLIDLNKKPLGKEEQRAAPVKNIQTVEFQRKGLINLILNYGTVKIKIGNEELTFDNVYYPSQVQSEIYARYRQYTENIKREDQSRMADWIKTYDELRQNDSKTKPMSDDVE
jgi:hypothetical protein